MSRLYEPRNFTGAAALEEGCYEAWMARVIARSELSGQTVVVPAGPTILTPVFAAMASKPGRSAAACWGVRFDWLVRLGSLRTSRYVMPGLASDTRFEQL